jgi:pimeloyl-ACP methyl ester carboxylesterase
VILAGHSMGGAASIMAAAIRPARVRALTLFDPVVIPLPQMLGALAPWSDVERFRAMPMAARALTRRSVFPSAAEAMNAYRGRGAFRGWPDTVLADYIAGGFRPRPDGQVELACAPAWEASNFSAMANNIWGLAGRVRAPMFIYRAETGSTCSIGGGRLFLRANRRSTLTVVGGSTHFLPMERPDLVREAILDAAGPARVSP